MQEARYFFVFDYGFGSFGVAADTLQEARAIFRKSVEGELNLPRSFPEEESWKRESRRQRRLQRIKDSGLDVDLVEPTIYTD